VYALGGTTAVVVSRPNQFCSANKVHECFLMQMAFLFALDLAQARHNRTRRLKLIQSTSDVQNLRSGIATFGPHSATDPLGEQVATVKECKATSLGCSMISVAIEL